MSECWQGGRERGREEGRKEGALREGVRKARSLPAAVQRWVQVSVSGWANSRLPCHQVSLIISRNICWVILVTIIYFGRHFHKSEIVKYFTSHSYKCIASSFWCHWAQACHCAKNLWVNIHDPWAQCRVNMCVFGSEPSSCIPIFLLTEKDNYAWCGGK